MAPSDQTARSTVTANGPDDLSIVVRTPRRWPLVAFLSLWICGWAVGEIVALTDLALGLLIALTPAWLLVLAVAPVWLMQDVSTTEAISGLISALVIGFVWLPFWSIAGALMLYALLWNLRGREEVRINPDTWTTQRSCGLFTRARTFAYSDVQNLRYSPVVFDWWTPARPFSLAGWREAFAKQLQMMGVDPGRLAFDCLGKTYRFGSDLTEDEALRIIVTIQDHFPIPDGPKRKPLPVAR